MPPVLCTVLLVAVILLAIFALIEVIGLRTFTGQRYGLLVGFIVALVLYIVLC